MINKLKSIYILFTVPSDPIWCLERRESSGHLFWRRDFSKVKFRCDVEVLEYIKDPNEHLITYENNKTKNSNMIMVCATCVAAIAVTVILPWLLIGSSY